MRDEVGKFIKELRVKNNYTQEELARKLFVSRQTISNIENGKCSISYELAEGIGKLFNIDAMDIILAGKSKDISKEEVSNIIISFGKRLNNKFKKIVCFFSVIIVILLLLLSIVYLNLNYNTIKFYNLYGISETYKVNNGLMVLSKEKMILKLEVDKSFDNNSNHKINKLSLIRKDNDKLEEIYSIDDDKIYLVDNYGYDEYFNYSNIVNSKEKLSIKIYYDDDKEEEIELNFNKIYENKKIIFFKKKNILK